MTEFNDWENISLERIAKVRKYIDEYCTLTDKDYLNKKLMQSIEHYGGGSGGICAYKVYKRMLRYIYPLTSHLKYGYVAAAVCFVLAPPHGYEEMSASDLQKAINLYTTNWYNHTLIIDGHRIWFSTSISEQLLHCLLNAYKETGGLPQIGVVLQVLYAMQWDERRIDSFNAYLKSDRL